jgi:hypothetical protein
MENNQKQFSTDRINCLQSASERWKKPPMGWVKLNTDASFCHKSGAGGAGAVARGAVGEVLFAACSPLGRCNSPKDAESKAALFGLSLV